MWGITLCTNIHVQGVPKEERIRKKKKILEEIMAKNFPYETYSLTHPKVQQTPSR